MDSQNPPLANPIQQIAKQHLEANDPLGWFEEVYQKGKSGEIEIPWADFAPNPNIKNWFDKYELKGEGKSALVIGCGLGEDAEYLQSLGFETDAFDISPTAIDWCKERWKESKVNYFVADLFQLPAKQYDFVLEIYTVQTLPPPLRLKALKLLPTLLSPNGQMLLVCRGREEDQACEDVPFPLTKTELSLIENSLYKAEFEDYEEGGIRRFRGLYAKVALM